MRNEKPDLRLLRKEIGELSSNLKRLSTQKEKNYQGISDIGTQLNELLKQAIELKNVKQSASSQIQQKKEKRDELNVKVSNLAIQLKELKPKKALPKDHTSASIIQKQVDTLSMKLQTEVYKFKQEQAIMGQLKEMKRKLKKSLKEEETLSAYIKARKELIQTKSQADDMHKYIQDLASKNSEFFEKLSTVSKKIAELKDKRKQMKSLIDEHKKQIFELDKKLADRLGIWSTGRKKIDDLRLKTEQAEIVRQIQVVETKLKEKKKLTTEDILAMQREAMGRR